MKAEDLKTPFYLVDESLLLKNLEILKSVADTAGCKILLAQKAFSMHYFYPLIGKYLSGTAASGLFEARLGREAMGKENHIFSPAYTETDFGEILDVCDHIIFNSFPQWEKFRERALRSGKSFGMRVNPEFSTQARAVYDPCAPYSRLGVTLENFREDLLDGLDGLHFHTLCEQDSDALETTLEAVEEKFGAYLKRMKWINFGGGHHITREGYDIPRLIKCVSRFREKYGLEVYLEPGEAVALNAGWLFASVIDVFKNGKNIAVLDVSAACHMPDVLEMPYRPPLLGSGEADEKEFGYILGGPSCLAGDVIGEYSFDRPLKPGDRLVLGDMAIYSMVKSNTFNGIPLPAIAAGKIGGNIKIVRKFGYDDFRDRLS
ncbi:MAG: carboxynorspermidine decarboxylase [Oscillospiraceae bacterium]|jgi:carboxynorspermidine decarboxylase|nr:carboxynorspermidine decarboxylase [Oscillospiraceae bacterium]